VRAEQRGETRLEEDPRDQRIDDHAQEPGRARPSGGGLVRGLIHLGHERRYAVVEALALLGEHDGARGALEETYAHALLEARDGAADAGLGEAEHLASAHEAASVGDRKESGDPGSEDDVGRSTRGHAASLTRAATEVNARVVGSGYALYVVVLAEVAQAEKDEIAALFSGPRWTEGQLAWWWRHSAGSMEGVNVEQTEDYEQIIRDIVNHLTLEQRLAGLLPEQRLAGLAPEQLLAQLAPEQLLAGLDRDHQALALPIDVLRVLPEEYIRSLSVEVQEEIRRRIRSGRA
jgi:hypothetical protein